MPHGVKSSCGLIPVMDIFQEFDANYAAKGDKMKKIIMIIVSVAAIAGIVITAVCMPEDRFE